MKLIALDVGTKRIGVAKADSSVRVAVPYSAIEVDGTEFDKIASLARAWDINCFVLGMPRNLEGQETEQSRYTRKFAKDLKMTIPDAKVCFQDESLTSVEAEKRLKGRKKGYKKGDVDSEAAAIILQDFLEEHIGKDKTNKPKTKAAAAKKRKSVKARKSHKLLTAVVIIVLLLGLAAGGGFMFYQYGTQAVGCGEGAEKCPDTAFTVAPGSGVNDIAVNLESAGLVRNALVFQVFYRLNYSGETLQAGEYTLNQAMTPNDIILTMIDGNDKVFKLTLLPGATVADFRGIMAGLGYDEAKIDEALKKSYTGEYSWIFEGKPEEAGLEGYLYGETYEFFASDPVETVIERMLEEMATVLEENGVKEQFAARGWTIYQGLTLASVVQKEANNAVDYARVAKVFYNRLDKDMNLGSDVTAKYAADLVDPGREVYADNAAVLEIDSPYNTRKNKGLPYGPICNPGIEAILATATPDDEYGNYLFFLTGDDGLMYYSDTEEGHSHNIEEHCQSLCSVAL